MRVNGFLPMSVNWAVVGLWLPSSRPVPTASMCVAASIVTCPDDGTGLWFTVVQLIGMVLSATFRVLSPLVSSVSSESTLVLTAILSILHGKESGFIGEAFDDDISERCDS